MQGAKGLVGTGRKVTNPVKAGYPKQLEYILVGEHYYIQDECKKLPWTPDSYLLTRKHSMYIRTVHKLLAFLMQWYIRTLPGWSGAEIKCTVNVFSAQTAHKLV